MSGRVVAVGLGPAGADHLLPVARDVLSSSPRVYARTVRHPAVDDLVASGLTFESFDSVYDAAPDLEAAYAEIARRLVDAANAHGEVVYAVPGSPAVAERAVTLLRADPSIEVVLVPGVSFADLAWVRLGVDPMDGDARVVDGRAIDDAELAGRLLIAQCDNQFVLSDVKLALLEHLGPETPVTVLQRLGLPDERVTVVALEELDRGGVEPDHLTSVFVDAGAVGAARELMRLVQLTKRLRDPGGCPWDAEQTHASLTRYLLEEAYETVEAIEHLDVGAAGTAALQDELGDVLYQVVLHAAIAQETGEFTLADVARGVHDKLVHRHPHVFGDVVAEQTADVMRNWEQIKMEEKGTSSMMAGLTPGLPSLLYTHKMFRKAASVGLDPGGLDEAIDRIDAALTGLRTADGEAELQTQLARLLAASVVVARASGVDAESALRGWAADYRHHFEAMEALAIARDLDLAALDPAGVAALWLESGS